MTHLWVVIFVLHFTQFTLIRLFRPGGELVTLVGLARYKAVALVKVVAQGHNCALFTTIALIQFLVKVLLANEFLVYVPANNADIPIRG